MFVAVALVVVVVVVIVSNILIPTVKFALCCHFYFREIVDKINKRWGSGARVRRGKDRGERGNVLMISSISSIKLDHLSFILMFDVQT